MAPRRRRIRRLVFWLGVLAGATWLVQRYQRTRPEPAASEVRAPVVAPMQPAKAVQPAEPEQPTPPPWVVPDPGGTCPPSHPVKAKLKSNLYHLPGMLAYDRTNPDRCYVDEAAAEADGLRRAKR